MKKDESRVAVGIVAALSFFEKMKIFKKKQIRINYAPCHMQIKTNDEIEYFLLLSNLRRAVVLF